MGSRSGRRTSTSFNSRRWAGSPRATWQGPAVHCAPYRRHSIVSRWSRTSPHRVTCIGRSTAPTVRWWRRFGRRRLMATPRPGATCGRTCTGSPATAATRMSTPTRRASPMSISFSRRRKTMSGTSSTGWRWRTSGSAPRRKRRASAVLRWQKSDARPATLNIPYAHHALARLYVAAGDQPRAIAQLDSLLAKPYVVSPAWLRIDPTWASLRSRFALPAAYRPLGKPTAVERRREKGAGIAQEVS